MVQGAYAIHAPHHQQRPLPSSLHGPHCPRLTTAARVRNARVPAAQDPIAVGNMITLNGLTRALVGRRSGAAALRVSSGAKPPIGTEEEEERQLGSLGCAGVSSGRLLINNFGIDAACWLNESERCCVSICGVCLVAWLRCGFLAA